MLDVFKGKQAKPETPGVGLVASSYQRFSENPLLIGSGDQERVNMGVFSHWNGRLCCLFFPLCIGKDLG